MKTWAKSLGSFFIVSVSCTHVYFLKLKWVEIRSWKVKLVKCPETQYTPFLKNIKLRLSIKHVSEGCIYWWNEYLRSYLTTPFFLHKTHLLVIHIFCFFRHLHSCNIELMLRHAVFYATFPSFNLPLCNTAQLYFFMFISSLDCYQMCQIHVKFLTNMYLFSYFYTAITNFRAALHVIYCHIACYNFFSLFSSGENRTVLLFPLIKVFLKVFLCLSEVIIK